MKSKTSAALLLILTFLMGAVTGAVSYYLYHDRVAAATVRSGGSHDPVNQLAQALSLDPNQKEELKVIMEQSRDRYRALSQQMRPQYEAIRNEMRQQIRQILRDDQKPRFEEFLKNLERLRQREHDSKGSQ